MSKRVKIIAEPIKAEELELGDLYHCWDGEMFDYWQKEHPTQSIDANIYTGPESIPESWDELTRLIITVVDDETEDTGDPQDANPNFPYPDDEPDPYEPHCGYCYDTLDEGCRYCG